MMNINIFKVVDKFCLGVLSGADFGTTTIDHLLEYLRPDTDLTCSLFRFFCLQNETPKLCYYSFAIKAVSIGRLLRWAKHCIRV